MIEALYSRARCPRCSSLPKVGLQVATPQYADGRTSEPPVCVPKAPRHMPIAKAAADPLLGRPACGPGSRDCAWAGIKAGELDGDRLSQDHRTGPAQGSDQRRVGRGCLLSAQRRSGPRANP